MVQNRIEYIDTLKFLAILGIVFIHVSAIWPNAEVLHLNIRDMTQIFRWGVPIFIMISGALLLNREIELTSFFKKRFVRVFYPLLFFIIITDIIQHYNGFLNSFWFCWMILGAYLAIPIINKFIQHSDEGELKYYVAVILISSVIYQVAYSLNIPFALDITFFISPVSYLVLGYYLSQKEFKNPVKVILIAILLFVITTIVKYHTGSFVHYGDDIFTSVLDISIVQIVQASSVFIIVKEIYSFNNQSLFKKILGNDIIKNFILSVSKASYGMYLIQFLYRDYFWSMVSNLTLSGSEVFSCFILISILVFFASWISIWVLGKIPFINKFSGYAG